MVSVIDTDTILIVESRISRLLWLDSRDWVAIVRLSIVVSKTELIVPIWLTSCLETVNLINQIDTNPIVAIRNPTAADDIKK